MTNNSDNQTTRLSYEERIKQGMNDGNGGIYSPNGKVFLKYEGTAKSYTIRQGVTGIYHRAFQDCTSLERIEIPDTIEVIGRKAFSGCNTLKEISLPESVTHIGGSMFFGCTSLEEVIIPNSVTEIEWESFGECTSLKEITIPESVTNMSYCGFYNLDLKINCLSPHFKVQDGVVYSADMSRLLHAFESCPHELVIPKTVTTIDVGAFMGCTKLQNIILPEGLKAINDSAFMGCSALMALTIPSSVTQIGLNPIAGSGIKKITCLSPIFNVHGGALYSADMSRLIACFSAQEDFTVPNTVRIIEDRAFSCVGNPRKVTLSNSQVIIHERAFGDCGSIEQITITYATTDIKAEAFNECYNLKRVIVPKRRLEDYKNILKFFQHENVKVKIIGK